MAKRKKTSTTKKTKRSPSKGRTPARRPTKPTFSERAAAWARRNRVLLIGLAVLALIVILAVVWASTQDRGPKQWDQPPPMTIDSAKQYYATIQTEKGDIRVQLFADKAPETVNNFVFLARQHFYDNTTFHRVIPGFMAQGGDPTGTGSGGPGYTFADEFHPDLRHDSAGILSMANAGANTNGSQFFIAFAPLPHLDGAHAVFGKVVSGMEVLNSLTPRDPQENPDYTGDRILTITIEEQ